MHKLRYATWLLPLGIAWAQSDRIAGPIDHYRTVTLSGHLNPRAAGALDQGAVPPDFPLRGLTLMVRRTPAQQQQLNELLAAQQNPGSPPFHHWLTPEEFAKRFGASPNDLAALRQWLESYGFQIHAVARGGGFIRFDGTAGQVRQAFATEIHEYAAEGGKHYANAGDPSVPANIAPLVLYIGGMTNFGPHPHYVKVPYRQRRPGPNYTYDGGSNALAPGDLYTIYDVTASYGWSWAGSGQTIVLVDASDVTPSDIALYRSSFGLAPTTLLTEHPDGDPGLVGGWQTEATLDIEISGALAPNAQLLLEADFNLWNGIADAIDNFRGQVISMSFGECEFFVSEGEAAGYESIAQQANAEGITMIASAGDSGATGCDPDGSSVPLTSTMGVAVSLPASLPQVTAVGGTEFNEEGGSYWGSSNSTSGGTAISYIPEVVWNDIAAGGDVLWAGGGGVSVLFTKPSWQTGVGVPADGHRDVPDVAFTASGIHDGYVIAMGGSLSTAQGYTIGGTSASAPLFAGMVAVLNSGVYDDTSGNINPVLYTIANGGLGSQAFHDITSGNNQVETNLGLLGYTATTGYDQTTGWGSVDLAQLTKGWASYKTVPEVFSVLPQSAAPGSGNSVPVTISGAQFQSGDSVVWSLNGTNTTLSSSYTNSSTMTATVPASLLTTAGTAQIQVVNAAGLHSVPSAFYVTGAALTGVSPTSATAGGKAFTLTVNGTGFIKGAKIMWNSTALTTTYVSATKLTGAVTAAMIASDSMIAITVADGIEGTSPCRDFWVELGTPTISSLSPNSAPAGGSGFTLTVNGTNFVSSAVVMWGSTQLTTTVVSATKLTATVTGTQLASSGKVSVTVSDGITSSGSNFTVAAPAISSLSPKTIAAGSGATTLKVTGTNFVASGSSVYVGTTALNASAVTATSITATIPSTMLGATGSLSITVQNPNESATSSVATVSVMAPTITELSPKTIPAGAGSTTLTVTGTNFVANGSTAYVGTTALTSTTVTATSITASIPSSMLGATGNLSVTVQNPNDAAASSAATVTVVAPTISSISPTNIAAGALGFTITVKGTNFLSGTTVMWGSTALSTSFVSATEVQAKATAAAVAGTGTDPVTVANPGGQASSAVNFTVTAAPAITTLSPNSASHGGAGFTLTVSGTSFASGSVVWFGTTALTTKYVSATGLTATVPASAVASAAEVAVTVILSSGSTSAGQTFTVN